MGRLIVFIFLTFAFIAFDWYKKKDNKKSLFAILLFFYLIGLGYSGAILTRPILPLFIVHIVFVIISYIGLFIYLLKRKFLWYLFALPLLSFLLAFGLNYLDGSRFES